jgi:hypothetical protein
MKPVNSLGFEPSRWVAAVINSSTSYDTDPRLSDGFSCSRRAYRIFCGRSLHDRSFWADGIQPKGWVAEKGLERSDGLRNSLRACDWEQKMHSPQLVSAHSRHNIYLKVFSFLLFSLSLATSHSHTVSTPESAYFH